MPILGANMNSIHLFFLNKLSFNDIIIYRPLNQVHKQFIDSGSMVWDHSHSTRETTIVETQAREQATSQRWATHWATHWTTHWITHWATIGNPYRAAHWATQ